MNTFINVNEHIQFITMKSEVPYLTETQIRGLIYIADINHELQQDKPASITELSGNSEWPSSYYTKLWQSLAPQLIERSEDGQNTRLKLTEEGTEAVSLYKSLNHVFSDAGL